jgi:hypothetical protein
MNNTDIIDEIEIYLSKYRQESVLKLKYLDEPQESPDGGSNCFNKTWCKLGMPEKLNRLMRYLTKVQQKLNLDAAQTEYLRKFFYENVNTSLSSDDCVSYDPVESEIITIIGLKCEGNNFYIQQADTKPKPEGVRVKQRVFADLSQLLSASKKEDPPPLERPVTRSVTKAAAVNTEIKDEVKKRTVVIKKKLNPPSE